MERKYVSTVKMTWDLYGNATADQINERLKLALSIIMSTPGGADYAMFDGLSFEVETKEVPPRTISDELREKILNDTDFLRQFAHTNFMYDGLEYDHARHLLGDDSDDTLCDDYSTYGGQDEEIVAELKKLGKWSGEEEEKEN